MSNWEIMDSWAHAAPSLVPTLGCTCACAAGCDLRCICGEGENHQSKHDWQDTQYDSGIDFSNEQGVQLNLNDEMM